MGEAAGIDPLTVSAFGTVKSETIIAISPFNALVTSCTVSAPPNILVT